MYADIGSPSFKNSCQLLVPTSLETDSNRVEYALINLSIQPQPHISEAKQEGSYLTNYS